jgi:hypothetical protein
MTMMIPALCHGETLLQVQKSGFWLQTLSPRFVMSLGILLLATGTTLAILWFLARRWMAKGREQELPLTKQSTPDVDADAVLEDEEEYIREEPMVQALSGIDEEESPGDDDVSSLSLARRMNRGRGEFDLAHRLETIAETTKDLGGMIHGIIQESSSGPERIKAAKRLGIGRGEVDLALRLEQFQHHKESLEQSNG